MRSPIRKKADCFCLTLFPKLAHTLCSLHCYQRNPSKRLTAPPCAQPFADSPWLSGHIKISSTRPIRLGLRGRLWLSSFTSRTLSCALGTFSLATFRILEHDLGLPGSGFLDNTSLCGEFPWFLPHSALTPPAFVCSGFQLPKYSSFPALPECVFAEGLFYSLTPSALYAHYCKIEEGTLPPQFTLSGWYGLSAGLHVRRGGPVKYRFCRCRLWTVITHYFTLGNTGVQSRV